MTDKKPILEVKDLKVEFDTYGGVVKAVRGVSFEIYPGETLAIVGESGCGKSVTCQSLMGLIPQPPGRIVSGTAHLQGRDILAISPSELREVRGKELGMIFQDPLTSLNPTMKVGDQIAEVIIKHRKLSRGAALKEAGEIMQLVQIPEATKRMKQYPHEFSGGMRQRVMIAIALACRPKVLIADEPTTALDVTIQGQILNLLKNLQNEINMAVILITHDLGVVASVADRVAVMYAGQVVETGSVDEIFYQAGHPYTVGLQDAIPNPLVVSTEGLTSIPGSPPDLFSPPIGCGFYARCPSAMKVCEGFEPPKFNFKRMNSGSDKGDRYAHCWLHHNSSPEAYRSALKDHHRQNLEVQHS
jgi:oligopeptide/dipeptide ABC transporter ATP-binding protein